MADASILSVWGEDSAALAPVSSWYGNTGLIVIPTATTLPAAGVTVGYHSVDRSGEDMTVMGVNFGLTKDLEIGGTRMDIGGGDNTQMGHVKYHVNMGSLLDNPNFPQVVVGVWDVTNQFNRAYYVAIGKTFSITPNPSGPKVNLTAGYAANDLGAGSLNGFFGGIEVSAFSRGLIQAEWDGNAFNADFRLKVSDRLTVEAGVLDSDFGWGASYTSGF
jgi:hypothetical protein